MAGKASRGLAAGLAVSASALVGLGLYEGYGGTAYQDSGGIWTLGFGETAGVKPGQSTTPQRALVQLLKSAEAHADGVRACVSVPLYQHEFDAYVSLAYNVGVGAVCASSIPNKLAALDYAAACKTILDFDRARDCSKPKVIDPRTGRLVCPLVQVRGLTLRRQAEYRTCTGADAEGAK